MVEYTPGISMQWTRDTTKTLIGLCPSFLGKNWSLNSFKFWSFCMVEFEKSIVHRELQESEIKGPECNHRCPKQSPNLCPLLLPSSLLSGIRCYVTSIGNQSLLSPQRSLVHGKAVEHL
ncbi:hypothetical protein VNO77_14785 [Canavalia gladiata]|uniref:Uncharacterized protein n=1 Tax=Canavalia gladiata TaxID=3824 RepID=A0AAN9QVK3_CANGL